VGRGRCSVGSLSAPDCVGLSREGGSADRVVHAQCALSFGWERPDRRRFGLVRIFGKVERGRCSVGLLSAPDCVGLSRAGDSADRVVHAQCAPSLGGGRADRGGSVLSVDFRVWWGRAVARLTCSRAGLLSGVLGDWAGGGVCFLSFGDRGSPA
jgi:hypothetical protein